MSIDPKNVVNITGGIVQDPEIINGKILKLRVAVDFAGQDKTTENRSGYFDVTYFQSDNVNSKFVFDQVEKKNFKKGTQLQLVGRLVQERWEKEGQKNQRVVIVAEGITYASSAPRSDTPAASTEEETPLPTKF